MKKTRAKDCIVNDLFVNSNDPEYQRNEYCRKFCRSKCHKGQEYKKRFGVVRKET